MICYTDKLNSAINASCPSTFGMERSGYLCLRSEINPKTEVSLLVDFVPRLMIPIYQPSENPYAPKSNGEKNAFGLTKFAKTVEVFLIANTSLTQQQIMQLKDEDWVAVLKQRDGQIIVFGFERGLRLKTSSQDLNSTETHGGILLTFDENYANAPMLFGDETLYNWSELDTIYGGTTPNGGVVKLIIDADKTGYVKLPNGVVLTTVAGVIDTVYSGVGGAITYYVPKTSSIANLGAGNITGITGAIVTNFANNINITSQVGITALTASRSINVSSQDCFSLTSLSAPKAKFIYTINCALTAKSIGDILYAAYLDNRANVNFDFSGGNNALYGVVNTYLIATYNVTMTDIEYLLVGLNEGIISIDTI